MKSERQKRAQKAQKASRAKKKKNKVLGWILFVLGIAVIVAVVLLLPRLMAALEEFKGRQPEAESSIVSAEVSSGTIETVLRGAGMLTDPEASYTSLPEDVVLEFKVEDGDLVTTGDLLATADLTSLMLTIAELQEALNELDARIEDARDGDEVSKVTAPAEGRVKAIYAEADRSVSDVMYDSGALIVLSLDGKMAVEIPSAGLSAGQSVQVTRLDGSVIDGRVSAMAGSTATVTVSDLGPVPGESVIVSDADGNTLGSGALSIQSELRITGYYGVIDEIHVEIDEAVDKDEKLLSIRDTDSSAGYAGLLAQRQAMEQQMQTLFRLYRNGGLYAESSGFVAEIEPTGSGSSSGSDNSGSNRGGNSMWSMSSAGVQATVQMLASLTAGEDLALQGAVSKEGTAEEEIPDPAPDPSPSAPAEPSPSAPAEPSPSAPAEPSPSAPAEPSPSVTPGASTLPSPTPSDNGEITDPSQDPSPSPEPEMPVAGFRDVYAKISRVNEDSLSVRLAQTEEYVHYGDVEALQALSYAKTRSTVEVTEDLVVFLYDEGVWSLVTPADILTGDHVVLTYFSDGESESLMWIICHRTGSEENDEPSGDPSDEPSDEPSPSPSPSPGRPSGGSGEFGGFGGSGFGGSGSRGNSGSGEFGSGSRGNSGSGTGSNSSTATYTLTERQVCAITPDNNMTVQMMVDELDILKLYNGQEVTLRLDAINGRDWTGTITDIAAEASSTGGSAKFAVTVELQRDLDMRTGMNAAVTVLLSTKEAERTLPAEALVEIGSRTYVYTSYDEKTEELGGLLEVETGLSDGQIVEILTELAPGTTVYYEYKESDE